MEIGIELNSKKGIIGNKAREAYFLKIALQLLIPSAYIFGLLNFYFDKPLIITDLIERYADKQILAS